MRDKNKGWCQRNGFSHWAFVLSNLKKARPGRLVLQRNWLSKFLHQCLAMTLWTFLGIQEPCAWCLPWARVNHCLWRVCWSKSAISFVSSSARFAFVMLVPGSSSKPGSTLECVFARKIAKTENNAKKNEITQTWVGLRFFCAALPKNQAPWGPTLGSVARKMIF